MERRRGRPPHPDILTPREWEVLALLRQSLSNEQIAERLDISVPGVKYHVSEILSKLHVSSREEAAAWQPERTPSGWRRAMALPIVAAGAKAASIGVVAATLIAIGVVTWGVVASEGPDGSDQEALVPSPGSSSPRAAPVAGPVTLDAAGSDFTADHAIMYVVSASEAIQPNSVSAVLTTYEEARELTNERNAYERQPADDPIVLFGCAVRRDRPGSPDGATVTAARSFRHRRKALRCRYKPARDSLRMDHHVRRSSVRVRV